jgi:hypothetical protein
MVKGRGEQLDRLASLLVKGNEVRTGVRVGVQPFFDAIPNSRRSLRVCQRIAYGSVVTCDVSLWRQDADLYMSITQRISTLLGPVRYGLLSLATLCVCGWISWFVITKTLMYDSWVRSFSNTYSTQDRTRDLSRHSQEDNQRYQAAAYPQVLFLYIRDGDLVRAMASQGQRWKPDERSIPVQYESLPERSKHSAMEDMVDCHKRISELKQQVPALTTMVPGGALAWAEVESATTDYPQLLENISLLTRDPWSPWQLFKADPKLFFVGVGGVPLVMSILAMVGVLVSSRFWFLLIARAMSWPTPDQLEMAVESNTGSVLRTIMAAQTGIGSSKEDMLEL